MPFKSEKQRKWMHANEPEMAKKWEKEEESVDEEKKRDYKAEYKKYGSSTKAKKYRAELNQYNRKKGTYGNGDGKDASHKGGKIVGFENQSVNRGRAEKSRLRKEAIFEDMNDAQLANGIKHWSKQHKGTGIGYGHVLGQLAVHMKEMGWNKSYKEVARIAVELGKKKTVESVKETMLSENPAAAAGAAMAAIQIQNAQGKKIKGTSALQSSDPSVQKKAKGIFQRLKDKFAKGKGKRDFEKQKKAVSKGAADYVRKLDKESVNEISFSHVSTKKLVTTYKQMADERLSAAAALTFRLIAKELKKRKVKLPESVNEEITVAGYKMLKQAIRSINRANDDLTNAVSRKLGINQIKRELELVQGKVITANKLLKQKKHNDPKIPAHNESVNEKTVSIGGEELMKYLMKRFKMSKSQAIASMKKHKMDMSFLKNESITEDWWSDMSSYDQSQYIKDHPNSDKAKSSKKARKDKQANRKKLAKRGYDIDATTGKAVKKSEKEDPKKKEKHKKAISKGIFPGSPEYSKFMKESVDKIGIIQKNFKWAKGKQITALKMMIDMDADGLAGIIKNMKKNPKAFKQFVTDLSRMTRMRGVGESVNEKVVKVSKDIPGNLAKMKGEEKIKKLTYSGSNGKGSYEIKSNKLNVIGIRPRDKGFFVNHFTKNTGFRKANLYYDGVHWQDKKKF